MKNKKIVQINTVCNGSTGRIMHDIQEAAKRAGYDTFSFYGRRKGFKDLPCEKIGNPISFWIHVAITTVFDWQGKGSYFYTKRLVNRLRDEKPDIIHLHNVHGYYLNLSVLFHYLRNEFGGKIIWTFHDCWPVTGHCPHFVIAECNKWMTGCNNCPNKKYYPISLFFDSSKSNYIWKRELFSNIKNFTIICPSRWMQKIVQQSFLKNTKSVVIPNGIDLELFQPCDYKKAADKYQISNGKKVILGVASVWEPRKGLNDFIELSKAISEKYVIVLVGLKRWQMKQLPPNIIGIQHTENQKELAQLYSRADVFFNPSKEESFSLVTIEAMACGTPVIAFDTSATKELVNDDNGILIHNNDISNYLMSIDQCMEKNRDNETIRSSVKKYSISNMTNRVLELYK